MYFMPQHSINNEYTKYYYGKSYCYKPTQMNKMKLFGEGIVKVTPNLAIMTLGVITEDRDLEAARYNNANKTRAIIKTIKNNGIKDEDIQTDFFSIAPQYDYVDDKKVLKGYKVENILRVNINDVEKIGEIIDASVRAGANLVNDISFTVKNPEQYYKKALNLAIKNAIDKANNIAKRLKVEVSCIPINIEEERTSYVPIVRRGYMESTQATTPIEKGLIDFNAKIEAIFSYKI